MKVADLTEELLRKIKLRDFDRIDHGDNLPIQDFMASEYKKAIIDGDEVIMALGAQILGDFAYSWLVASDGIYRRPHKVLSTIEKVHYEAEKFLNVKWLYTCNRPDATHANKLLKYFGYVESRRSNDFEDGIERIVYLKRLNHG